MVFCSACWSLGGWIHSSWAQVCIRTLIRLDFDNGQATASKTRSIATTAARTVRRDKDPNETSGGWVIHTQDSAAGEATETVWLRGWRRIRPESTRARRDTVAGAAEGRRSARDSRGGCTCRRDRVHGRSIILPVVKTGARRRGWLDSCWGLRISGPGALAVGCVTTNAPYLSPAGSSGHSSSSYCTSHRSTIPRLHVLRLSLPHACRADDLHHTPLSTALAVRAMTLPNPSRYTAA
ncbi:hypothetical protein BKA81DRAFT_215239 [Phyllosticta paracitricarpa]